MSKKVIVIGGGIVGLCSAYFLHKEGYEVVVIDKSDISKGASFVNAGFITPSHIISLAAPGIITKGIKWMFDASSPFYIKPRLDTDFLKWALAFKKSATKKKVEQAIPVIKDFNLLSQELYQDFKASSDFDFHYTHKGLLMCYKTDKAGEKEWNVGKRAINEGLEVEHLSKKEVAQLEPKATINFKGAVHYKCDAHSTPQEFMSEMLAYLKRNNVTFLLNEEVKDIEIANNRITKLITNKKEITADEFLMTTGSWTPLLTKKLGINLLIQAGKGYRINVKSDTGITIPSVLLETKVAVTPMNGFTRIAGTMEVGGINHTINPIRVNAIANAAEKYYGNIKISSQERQDADCGLRPVSPDGLPFIGKSSKCKNLTIAAGHAMMGWSLGPATGKLVAEIISDQKPSLDLIPFTIDRKF